MENNEPILDNEFRDALAALVFAALRPLSEEQREQFAKDLWSMEETARKAGQPKSADLIHWLGRAAMFARRRHAPRAVKD